MLDGFWFSDPVAANSESLDPYGRPCPGAAKYPSANGSLKPLADAAHAAGLKLGIWQLFGVPKGAVTRRLPIFGSNGKYTAADIALNSTVVPPCGWAAWEGFSVNISHPAAELWYDSLALLWSEWDLDLVKLDCVFGGDWTTQRALETVALSTAIEKVPATIALSLSPGGNMDAEKLRDAEPFATAARVAPDLHGEWYEVYPQFFMYARQFHQFVPNATTPGLYLDFDIYAAFREGEGDALGCERDAGGNVAAVHDAVAFGVRRRHHCGCGLNPTGGESSGN